MPQLAQCLCLDLPDALARHREVLADLFERVLAAVTHPEPHLDHLLLARGERLQERFGLGDGSEHTLEEVGQNFAVTRERIRQIEAKALRKLRHPSRSRKLKAFLEGSRI